MIQALVNRFSLISSLNWRSEMGSRNRGLASELNITVDNLTFPNPSDESRDVVGNLQEIISKNVKMHHKWLVYEYF